MPSEAVLRGEAVIEALAGTRAGVAVLELAAERPGVHAVGGYVRDVLRGASPREIDLVVEGDALTLARELAGRLEGASVDEHERFGTAAVWAGEEVDLASSRAETYPEPGSLPSVQLGASLEADLGRRDFTVNALAVELSGSERGRVRGVPAAAEDLAARRLRVLHERSFLDDPTRLMRLARYAQRLGFEIEPSTAELAREALEAGALATVSGPRIGAELRLALEEPDPVGALESLSRLGVLEAIDPCLAVDADLSRAAVGLLDEAWPSPEGHGAGEAGQPRGLVVMGVAARGFPDADRLRERLDWLAFGARERETVVAAALGSAGLADRLAGARRPSEVFELLEGRPVEQVAVAGGMGAGEPVREWLGGLGEVRLEITGDDLLEAGVPPGPEIGRRLRAALARRLDGELAPGREAELEAALAAE